MTTSVNFAFLAPHDPALAELAAAAESLFSAHPRQCVATLRTFAEALARQTAAFTGLYLSSREELGMLLGRLRDQGVLDPQVAQLFRALREAGNAAVHADAPDRAPRAWGHGEALQHLRAARELAVWYFRAFNDTKFKPGPFLPPPDPTAADAGLREELERLRAEVSRLADASATADAEAQRRADAERRAAQAYADVEAAMALAEEATARLDALQKAAAARTEAVQADALSLAPEARAAVLKAAQAAAQAVNLDEAATRALIDAQLREAGWEADSSTLRFARGARPIRGRNLAIAEWPTTSGPADYALFVGALLVGVVEAKRQAVDVMSALNQAIRYARDVRVEHGAQAAGGPWGVARVPFVFSTNGRPFLQQLRTRSGIWWRDLRRPQNGATPLVGWRSPEGLLATLGADVDAAHAALAVEPTDYLGLRDYQLRAIRAVEAAICDGQREILVAMATGTGKTRTTVGLVYRLLKARRFRRVLFLVDRTSLGDQANETFEDMRLENLQTFANIYEVRKLGDVAPGPDTRLHFATVQAMVRRLLDDDAGGESLPVDAYDCVIVDESHRGYHLDRELSDVELGFRSEADYISKYRRVLDHFDAVRIGLTATPALHTVEIFGEPVFTYTYREAVIDGYLVDHEPPYILDTHLSRGGIHFAAEAEIPAYDTGKGELTLFRTPDAVSFEVEQFNKAVITEGFNREVVDHLLNEIDPFSPGKTLIFAVDNAHADLVVTLLRDGFRDRYPDAFTDELVEKITGAVDRPDKAIRRFRNEQAPNIVVTVDLLTTGVDIPKITTLVFLRRVNSRILFDQMRGRATRLCPELGKEAFRIFDAVGLFAAMKDFTEMKPVVANPKLPFAQLVAELEAAPDAEGRALALDQLIAKLQRKKRSLQGARLEAFAHLADASPEEVIEALRNGTPGDAAAWFAAHPGLATWLDEKVFGGKVVLISEDEDRDLRVSQDFAGQSPEDYLEAFRAFLDRAGNDLPALRVVMTRPRELTRKQLRDLRLALDGAGFSERALSAAWHQKTNQEVAASILGFIRQQALGDPLVPYSERVDRAVSRLLGSRAWTGPQRDWLRKIALQLRQEVIVDREALDSGAFKAQGGGFQRIDRLFDGHLAEVLGELHERIWDVAP